MFSGRTEHSLVPFQRGISPHLISGWKLVELKKSGSWRQNHLFRLCLPGTHPMDHSVCKVKARLGFPGLTLLYLVPLISYHHCNCYILYCIHTCILYVHHQECALGRRGLSRCPLGWAGARTMLITTQSGHLLMQTLLKIRTHKNTSHHRN